jgi:adenosine kinase
MSGSHHVDVPRGRSDIRIGIIAPDGREAMWRHAQQLHDAGIPFIFDPGQGLPMFDGAELQRFVDLATWVAVNDYEGRMLSDRTGRSLQEISRAPHLQGVVATLGAEGADVWINGECTRVPGLKAERIADPTGCGDAFRGGLLYGLERGWTLARSVALGNRLGALKIAEKGPQHHVIDEALRREWLGS